MYKDELRTILASDLNLELFKKRIPLSGGIELTNKCNFDCIHCYETVERGNFSQPFSTKNLKEIIDTFSEMGVISVFLTGGEAMMRPDFLEIYTYLRNKGIMVSVLTNGSTLNEKILEVFEEKMPKMIDVSLYGASEETYQKVTRRNGMFLQVINNLKELKRRNIPFQLKGILLQENVNDLNEMRKIAQNLNVPFKIYTDIRTFNNGDVTPLYHSLTLKQILNLEKEDAELQLHLQKSLDKNDKSISSSRIGKKYLCRIAQNSFFISYDGKINGCVRSRTNSIKLEEHTFKEAWEIMKDLFVDKKRDLPSPCETCELLSICDYCPGSFELETGSPEIPPKRICELTHLRAKKLK